MNHENAPEVQTGASNGGSSAVLAIFICSIGRPFVVRFLRPRMSQKHMFIGTGTAYKRQWRLVVNFWRKLRSSFEGFLGQQGELSLQRVEFAVRSALLINDSERKTPFPRFA